MPNLMFATTQRQRGGGFGGGRRRRRCAAGTERHALYKSTDAGKTWKKVDTLPPYNGRISVAIAMHTNGQRLYVVGGALQGGSGLYRSDDQGATWQHMAGDDTRIGNGQGALQLGRVGRLAESRHPLHGQHHRLSIDRRRQDVQRVQGRARRRGPARHLDRSDERPAHVVRLGSGPGASRSTAARPGAATTRSRSRRSTTSPPTRGIRTGCMGSQQDTGAIMTRSRSDQGQITVDRLVSAAVIGVRHGRARSAQANDGLRRRLRRRPGRRADQDRSRDRTVGQRRAELRRGLRTCTPQAAISGNGSTRRSNRRRCTSATTAFS